VGVFKWLYRLPGRINRWFGPTAAAANVESPTPLGPGVSAMGVRVVSQEVENATRSHEGEDPDA
jgi:hypothetical protein